MNQFDREMGHLEARMETVEGELQAIRKDVREIRDALVQARGGWFVLTLVFAAAASLGAFISRALPHVLSNG